MGTSLSRQNAAVEEADVSLSHPYKYPPRTGTYFGTHFIMGGERFDTPQPEAYLFGENGDLNFLGSRPTAFPYPPPQANEPTKTLKSLINIRKESVRFVKVSDSSHKNSNGSTNESSHSYNIEFVFDADAKCAIQIFYFCTEEVTANGLTYVPRDPKMTSDVYHCRRGVNQTFLQTSHFFNPTLYSNDLSYSSDRDVYPIVIQCVADEGPDDTQQTKIKQSHTTICVVDHHSDGTYGLRALKQKIFVDGLCYLLQEIYGIENKCNNKVNIDDETEDNSGECVICMSDTRDTLILPCRHLCLCNSCADSLRYQANNCPICRAPFRALLQIRAVQKSSNGAHINITSTQQQALQDTNAENIPHGYVAVSLIEALNGPSPNSTSIKSQLDMVGTDSHESESIKSAAELNRCDDSINDKTRTTKDKNIPPEIKMSVLLPKEDNINAKVREKGQRTKSGQTTKHQNRDSVHLVNEKNANNLHGKPTEQDDDSETENLSPLLYHKNKKSQLKHVKKVTNTSSTGAGTATTATIQFQTQTPQTALHIDGINESIDDTDTDLDEHDNDKSTRSIGKQCDNADIDGNNICSTEDSDYFTPEDPHTTILSPLCPDKHKDKTRSKESISSSAAPSPLVAIKDSSLPDSPSSSADSYSSSSSTRKLLSAPLHELQTQTTSTTATIPTPSLAASRIIDIKVRDDKKISIEKAVDV